MLTSILQRTNIEHLRYDRADNHASSKNSTAWILPHLTKYCSAQLEEYLSLRPDTANYLPDAL